MKLKTKEILKKQTGITLIALVVTMVVLLILAGVTVNTLFNDNGIIDRAKDAQNKMDEAAKSDLEGINSSNNWLEENGGIKNSTSNGGDTPTATWTQSKTTGTCKGIETTSKAYKLLFRNAKDSANCSYWLASSCVYADSFFSYFGLRRVNTSGIVNDHSLWGSDDYTNSASLGVRAVVSL